MRVYRASLIATITAALVAAVVIAMIDVAIAVSRSSPANVANLAGIVLALYVAPALVIGGLCGVVAGAWRATFAPDLIGASLRRLRDDASFDRHICAALLATATSVLAFVALVAIAAMKLVAGVERQSVGAVLFATLITLSLPLFAFITLATFRLTRRLAAHLPRPGRLSISLLLVGASAVTTIVAIALFVLTRLDWRALDLDIFIIPAGFLTIMAAWLLLWYGPLAGARQRLPARRALALVTIAIALLMPLVFLRGTPAPATLRTLTEHSVGARLLLRGARQLSDHDHDGYSAFLGGADCDDKNPAVHPDAREIPGNGIDDNCIGGDRAIAIAPPQATPAADNTRAFTFTGNLLFIIVDTMRADRLGTSGYRRDQRSLTPNLDALAATSSNFTDAYAQATNTARSLPSILTSRFPSQVAVDKHFRNFSQTLDSNITLFEKLADAGWLTTGYSSHYYFEINPGIRQGFSEYDNAGATSMAASSKDITAPQIVTKAIARLGELATGAEPFALFIHLSEPHSSYMPHPEFPVELSGRAGMRARYDYEIAFADLWVGKLLATLPALELDGNTMVVVIADHGEAFGEHRVAGQRLYYHGRSLYQELVHVPLIVHVPGLAATTITQPVMLIDVAPTILALFGLSAPTEFSGRSLLGAMLGEPPPPRPAYSEMLPAPYWNHSAKAMITGDGIHKLIYRISDRRFELYDLAADPGEERDIYAEETEIAARLEQQMVDWIEVDLD